MVCSAMPGEGGGLIVRPIGGAECASCGEPHLYALDEVVLEDMCAIDRRDGSVCMEWVGRGRSPLGCFCNSCGVFVEDAHFDAKSHFGSRLRGVKNIGEAISTMETLTGELASLSAEQLEARAERLEGQLETVRRVLASRKGYRD